MPSKVLPMLATLHDKPFDDPDWLYEIKWDGYRAIAEIKEGKVNLHSRKNISFNEKFSAVADELSGYYRNAIFDGEVVVLDDKGKSDFQLLQNYQKTGEGNIVYYIFDILYIDNYDLRELPLVERKKILKEVIPESDMIRYSDHIAENGTGFFDLAVQNGLEGILAKRADSKYITGKRSKEWLKLKTKLQQEAVIAGFTKPKGSRKAFGALVLGVYEGDELIYIGHTGGGFNDVMLKDIKKLLEPLIVKKSPFKKIPKTNTPVTWVEPKLICEVTFSEWTQDGIMRQPVFLGLREDKKPEEVIRETTQEITEGNERTDNTKEGKDEDMDKEKGVGGVNLKFTNLDKVYFPDDGYTKGDLIEYYESVAKYMLPYLKDRPQSLNRHPNGIYESSFFQKDMGDTAPDWATTAEIYSDSNDKNINYYVVTNKASLLYLANLGCIEINPWFSRVQNLDYPDYAVLDLDPEEIGFDKVIEAALAAKEVLDEAGAKGYCKTSGATGLHIYIPLKAKYDYETAKEFVHLIGKIVHSKVPEFTSLERSPSKRKKKIYLDYLQNRTGQTLAAPYSVRPRPGATVATPLEWKEVKSGLDPRQFTIKNTLKRIEKKGDIFKPVLGKGVDIEKCIKRLMKKYGE